MSQKLVPYEKYKDSGVEWLGQIPESWTVAGFSHLLESIVDYRGRTPEKIESGRFLVTARNIKNGRIDYTLSEEFLSEAEYTQFMERGFPELGDILFTTEAPLGEFALVDNVDVGLAQRIIKLRPQKDRLNSAYLLYFFLSDNFQQGLYSYATGSTALGIKAQRLCYLRVLAPSIHEQTRISNYLDKQTSRIDTLVKEQEELILLLKEKRQALISHAVTKGLDPNTKMKPSGVEWIGDIPEGWEARKLTNLSKLESGHTPSRQHPEWWIPEECIFPWFSLADVHQLRDERNFFVKETEENVSAIGLANSSARILPAGTVILSRTASVGFSGIIEVEMATTQDFVNFICGDKLNNQYLLYVFRSMKSEFKKLIMGSTHQTIYMPDAAAFIVPVPPLEEQILIVTYITDKVGEIDSLISEAESTITLLQEHRSALISAAVTGKVRVPA